MNPIYNCRNPHPSAYISTIPTAGPPLRTTWYFSEKSVSLLKGHLLYAKTTTVAHSQRRYHATNP